MSIEAYPGAVNGLIDSKGLARELGVSLSTIRSWRSRQAEWMPEPLGELSGPVWNVQDLEGLKDRIPSGVGRPAKREVVERAEAKFSKTLRRSRGIYYTPDDAAHFMARWLVRQPGGTYLEPSLGNGVFLRAVNDVEKTYEGAPAHWIGAELDPQMGTDSVQKGHLRSDELRIGDFLALDAQPVDGAIANPPYVRLRSLDEESRNRALGVSKRVLGETMRTSGSIWMPFVLHMVEFIKDGGRLAAVLPFDLTYVAYARPLWKHLAQNFGSLRVLRSRRRIFTDINQDVLILLAEDKGSTTKTVTYEAYESLDEMIRGESPAGGTIPVDSIVLGERAFQRSLLPTGVDELHRQALEDGRLVTASQLATFHIGYVAGDKTYFHPSEETIAKYQLPAEHLQRSLINARRVRGEGLRTAEFDTEQADLLWDPHRELTAGERKYIRHGERLGVHKGYKTQRRNPWYRVPGVETPDAIITVFSEQPICIINDAEWTASNSLLCAYMKDGFSAQQLAASWYTPLTLLSVGLEVHSLGGGVVVMVPREASNLTLLAPDHAQNALDKVEDALRLGDISSAYAAGTSLLREAIGTEGTELVLQSIEALKHWKAI